MSGNTVGEMRQLLGEIRSSVANFETRLAERREEARAERKENKEDIDRLYQQFRTFTHEIRQDGHVQQNRMELLKMDFVKQAAMLDFLVKRVEELALSVSPLPVVVERLEELETRTTQINEIVEAIDKPVKEWVKFNDRLGIMGVFAASLLTALGAIAGPTVKVGLSVAKDLAEKVFVR